MSLLIGIIFIVCCSKNPPACLVVRVLTTRRRMSASNSDAGMDVYSGSDSNFNRDAGLFSPHVQYNARNQLIIIARARLYNMVVSASSCRNLTQFIVDFVIV